jgi:flagellar biosynthesis protein FlhA
MTNDRKPFEFKKGVFMGIGDITAIVVTSSIIAIFILMLCPIPVLLLDILITFNIIFELVNLITVCRTKNKVSSLYPKTLILSTFSIFLINIAIVRFILTKGAYFDGFLICFISDLITSQGIEGLVTGFFILITLTVVHWLIIKRVERIEEMVARFDLDSFPVKEMAINAEYDIGAISWEESLSREETLLRGNDYHSLLQCVCKLISSNEIVRIVLFIVTILGGILISANIHNEITTDTIVIIIPRSTCIEAIKIYAPLAISSGFLFMFPVFIQSITIGIILKRTILLSKEANNT